MAGVLITVTCDWEGETLTTGDLQAMNKLNTELDALATKHGAPIPVTHFICPAYFSRIDPGKEEQRQKVAKRILDSGAIGPADEIGVHVHCWKSLALEAGIPERRIEGKPEGLPTTPQYYSRNGGSNLDVGYAVPLGIYAEQDVVFFLNAVKEMLRKYLNVNPALVTTFRCGGWVTCDVVFRALPQAKLNVDASAVPFHYIQTAIKEYFGLSKLDGWNISIWGNARYDIPAYKQNSLSFATYPDGILGMGDLAISLPAMVNGIVELPDTGMLLAWTNAALMCAHIDKAFELAQASTKDIYISIGLHQEGAGKPADFKVKGYDVTQEEVDLGQWFGIVSAVTHAITTSKNTNIPVGFLTVSAAAQKATS